MFDDIIKTKKHLSEEELNKISKQLYEGCYEILIDYLDKDRKTIQLVLENYINSILSDYDIKYDIEFDIEKYKINIIFK